jgi:hypothetical protein
MGNSYRNGNRTGGESGRIRRMVSWKSDTRRREFWNRQVMRLPGNNEHIETRRTEQAFGNNTERIAAYQGYNGYSGIGNRQPATVSDAKRFTVTQPETFTGRL